jgi:SagB-type dehydrogenase family enzyme
VRVRRARTLVVLFSEAGPLLQNFMTRQSLPCSGFDFDLVSRATEWTPALQFYSLYPGVDPSLIAGRIDLLTSQGFLIAEGTLPARFDLEYESFWKWDTTAGLYHFGMKDSPYLNPEQAAAWMEYRATTAPAVPLFTTNESCEVVHELPKPDLTKGLLGIMSRRRSIRDYLRHPMSVEALRDCLFAGLGITGFLDTHLPDAARLLPLKMTPSGGARNPYEAYVYVNNVMDLAPGIYHYSAVDNTLGLLTLTPPVTPAQLLIGQYWADEAGAVILLVANFERTMWKYPHATAYRVLLIEAGNVSQNISLAAADHDLSTTPTAAFSDTAAHALLQLDWIKQALVLAVLVGKPKPDAFETQNFIPNDRAKP